MSFSPVASDGIITIVNGFTSTPALGREAFSRFYVDKLICINFDDLIICINFDDLII